MKLCSSARRRGQALVVAVVMLILVSGLALTLAQLAGISTTRSEETRMGDELVVSARAGLAQTRLEVWEAYVAAKGGTPGNQADFRTWLEDPAGLGLDADETLNLPQLRMVPSAVGGKLLATLIDRSVERRDEGDQGTYLVMRAVARFAADPGRSRTAESVLRVGGQPWEGFRFALLANNVNCIFCHTRMNTVERFYDTAPGPHQRIKVASLESLLLRDGTDSRIAGTLYVQGTLMKKDGTVITADDLGTTSVGSPGGLEAEEIDASGKIVDPSNLVPFVSQGNSVQYANFYKHYPTDPALQVDGALPSKFPPIVPDEDGDRQIDTTEWSNRAASMGGSITGGVIVPVTPGGGTFSGTALPTTGTAGSFTSNTPNKHLVLVGTPSNPIVLNGQVAVDGDVIISGYVKGTDGVLVARGNMYIVGDIIYADGTDGDGKRTFGVAADSRANNIAFGAGGNIVHGPYNIDKGGGLITDATAGGFTRSETALFNRMEWTKTQPYYDTATGLVTASPNANTVANVAYQPGYVPRYYVMDQSGTPMMYMEGHTWDNVNGMWQGKEHGDANTVVPNAAAGVKLALNPQDNWISQANLKTLYEAEEAARLAANGGQAKPYEIDGLMYTDNAIMMLARKDSSGGGQMIVNGAILSADAGILVPGQNAKTNKWDEGSWEDGDEDMSEAAMGYDFNGDGDKSDVVTLKQIYDNRAAWGWSGNVIQRTDKKGNPLNEFKLDLNKDGDFKDKVALTPTTPLPDGGLMLNYDVRTTHLLQLEDDTEVEVFSVARRER